MWQRQTQCDTMYNIKYTTIFKLLFYVWYKQNVSYVKILTITICEKCQTYVKHCLVRFEVNLAHKGILLFTMDVVVPRSKRAISHCSHLGNIGWFWNVHIGQTQFWLSECSNNHN